MRARAEVDVMDKSGETPLYCAVQHERREAAEYLLGLGAKASKVARPPDWFVVMVERRARCRDACRVLYGVLRRRWTVCNQRVPRDMINVLLQLLWESWRSPRWALVK